MSIACKRCASEKYIKNGKVRGLQRYLCKNCGCTFTDTPVPGRPLAQKVSAVVLYLSGLSMNRTAKLIGVSTPTVQDWLEKFAAAFAAKPKPTGDTVVIEIDELWHYLKKSNKLWIWKAYDRDTGQLVDWECGDRDEATAQRLIDRLKAWGARLYCTDNYVVYSCLFPAGRVYQGKIKRSASSGPMPSSGIGWRGSVEGASSFPKHCGWWKSPWLCSLDSASMARLMSSYRSSPKSLSQ